MSIKASFDKLDPKQKKTVIWSILGIIVLIVSLTGYNMRSERRVQIAAADKSKPIELEPDMIKKTMLREQRRELDEVKAELKAIRKEQKNRPVPLQDTPAEPSQGGKEEHVALQEQVTIPSADEVASGTPKPSEANKEEKWPLPMDSGVAHAQQGTGGPPPPGAVPPPGTVAEPVMVGEIGMMSNPDADVVAEDSKKKGRTVYLPPSFMEANLLTGFDASTSGKGKGNPEPLLLRIKAPAILPNDIKADLAGCFIVAEAVGRLDKERADVRLTSLACLSNEGAAVIDTPIKGFVTDSDSKVGLSGRVVSRMGAATARAVVAGLFGGAGEWLKAASTTQSVSPLGSTSTVQGTSEIATYAIGGGLAEGADTLRDFYVDLVKQTTPVIEIGSTKKITVIISEGKELEIREINADETI